MSYNVIIFGILSFKNLQFRMFLKLEMNVIYISN